MAVVQLTKASREQIQAFLQANDLESDRVDSSANLVDLPAPPQELAPPTAAAEVPPRPPNICNAAASASGAFALLPVQAARHEVLRTIEANQVTLLKGETG